MINNHYKLGAEWRFKTRPQEEGKEYNNKDK